MQFDPWLILLAGLSLVLALVQLHKGLSMLERASQPGEPMPATWRIMRPLGTAALAITLALALLTISAFSYLWRG
jgi:hypothetical protein